MAARSRSSSVDTGTQGHGAQLAEGVHQGFLPARDAVVRVVVVVRVVIVGVVAAQMLLGWLADELVWVGKGGRGAAGDEPSLGDVEQVDGVFAGAVVVVRGPGELTGIDGDAVQ